MSDGILSVVNSASSQDLTTLTAVKQMLDMSGTENDTKISKAITQSSAAIASHCGRVFGFQRYSLTARLDRCRSILFLPVYPVKAIVSVTEDGAAVDAADYELDGKAGMLFRLTSDRRRDWSACKIVIVFDAGFSLPSFSPAGDGEPLPSDIEHACMLLTKSTWFMAPRDPTIRSEDIPDVRSVGYALPGAVGGANTTSGLPDEVAGKLEPYRNRKI